MALSPLRMRFATISPEISQPGAAKVDPSGGLCLLRYTHILRIYPILQTF